MKSLISTFIFLWATGICLLGYTQPVVYGLHFNRIGTSIPVQGYEEFVQVDPFSGNYTVMDTLPGVNAVLIGSSTFDHSNQRYIFWGMDTQNARRIYTVDATSGLVLNSPNIANNPVELQFDLKNGVLYGLNWDAQTQTEYLVTVNLSTGANSQVGSIAGVNAVVVSGTAFNSNNGTYYLYGVNATGTGRLYKVDASNGNILSQPLLSGLLSEFQFDVTTNTLYALYRPGTNGQALQLVEIDTLTAALTSVVTFPSLSGQFSGIPLSASTYDQSTGTYIFRGISGNGSDSLFAVNVSNGAVISSPMASNVIELEADNTSFAARRYNPNPGTGLTLQEDLVEVTAFPNPTTQMLQVEVHSKVPLDGEVKITDLAGQELDSRFLMTRKVLGYFEFDLSSLQQGIYLLQVNTQHGNKTLKIVRQ